MVVGFNLYSAFLYLSYTHRASQCFTSFTHSHIRAHVLTVEATMQGIQPDHQAQLEA